jgi:hypothetical protein
MNDYKNGSYCGVKEESRPMSKEAALTIQYINTNMCRSICIDDGILCMYGDEKMTPLEVEKSHEEFGKSIHCVASRHRITINL